MRTLILPLLAGVLLTPTFAMAQNGDLATGVPSDFPRFEFAGHDNEAALLNRYLWYHFHNRLGNDRVLFNKEYLTISDMWMGGAVEPHQLAAIQNVHRNELLGIRIDDDGYVNTHQHFSHAHDHGWPFPTWTAASNTQEGVAGKAAGWHFQDDGPLWVWDALRAWKNPKYSGLSATRGWVLYNVRSNGIAENKWQLQATGESPSIETPDGMEIDSFQAPFLQLRWNRTGQSPSHALPYIEWLREGDRDFGPDRRVYFHTYTEDHEDVSGCKHSLITMHTHPKWTGKIKRMRISLAPGESDVSFAIDSFFTVYDTRHTINNPIFILASKNYFDWTGDVSFLRDNVARMRTALAYQQTVMGGLKYKFIRVPWVGHDGIAGWTRNPDGSKTIHSGHGIGNNYWDIMPFGGDDMYATSQYYASLMAMASIEEAIRSHPEWNIPAGVTAMDPDALHKHAADVKATANRKFWNPKTGRFVACIDANGESHDYGFTFLNLDSIWYGIASDEHAAAILDWIGGKRTVEGDTATGADIYHWRFGPRATTKRNVDWYGQCWWAPESIAWGEQVQDGGAVLGFSFFDMWARLNKLGPDDAWNRLAELLRWEGEVWAEGGYRAYYAPGKRGATLQGGGTAGGIGIDAEFFESSLVPSIALYGFLGLRPDSQELRIDPKLPTQCPEMGVTGVLYHGSSIDVHASAAKITVTVKTTPPAPIVLRLPDGWSLQGVTAKGPSFTVEKAGTYTFAK